MSKRKDKQKNKQKETMLPVTISTGYYHTDGNIFENARQQIEKAGFYVQSIFNVIKLSTDAFETIGDRKMEQYLEDLRHLSEIGSGIAGSIFQSTMAYLEVEEGYEESNLRLDHKALDKALKNVPKKKRAKK